MPNFLNSGDSFPSITLYLAGGGTFSLPDDFETPMTIALFYRGHWWPFCRRLLAGYEERRAAFLSEGVSIVAGTVDTQEQTAEISKDLGFPVAYGMSRTDGDAIGSWWEERRDHIQPSEFVITKSGKVVMSTYSNSPIGRMDPAEALTLIRYLNAQRTDKKKSWSLTPSKWESTFEQKYKPWASIFLAQWQLGS